MPCESRLLPTTTPRRTKRFAEALLVAAIIIGALGVTPPASQAQQAGNAAPVGPQSAAPPPKAITPPPAESAAEILNPICDSGLMSAQSVYALPLNGFFQTSFDNHGSTDFTPERKL